MLKEIIYSTLDYFLDPKGTIEKISKGHLPIEKLGIIGLFTMFFSFLFSYFSRIDTGIIGSTLFIISVIIYSIFIVGFSLAIGKKPSIDVPRIIWFLLSIGIIDIIIILLFPLSFIAKWILNISLIVVFFIKLYYLIMGISIIFRVSKSTAFLIILSPYIIIGIILLLTLISSYFAISGAIEELLL